MNELVAKIMALGYGKNDTEISVIPTLEASAKYFHRTLSDEVDRFCDFFNGVSKIAEISVESVRTKIEKLISEVEGCRAWDSTFGCSESVAIGELKGYLNCAVDTDTILSIEREAYLKRVL